MKKIIFGCALCFATATIAQNNDSVFYYNANGQKVWWYVQEDVYAFRMQNGKEYVDPNINLNVVDKMQYREKTSSKLNIFEFKPNSNAVNREIEKGKPRSHPEFECEFPVLTKEKHLLKDSEKWQTTDDLLMIVFKDPLIGENKIAQFAAKYDLIQVFEVYKNLPLATWTYTFRKRTDKCMQHTTIDLARMIYEEDSELIKSATPNIGSYISHTCNYKPNEMSGFTQANRLWFIDNLGTQVLNPNNIGASDADADVCECWDQGYFGEGIKIAVIDFASGYEFSHDDLDGVFLQGYSFVSGVEQPFNTDTYSDPNRSHATSVVGLIAANHGDGQTIGVAPKAKILPILVTSDPANISQGIQKAISEQAHIVVMPFGSPTGNVDTILNVILQGVNTARPHPTNPALALGTIFVASVGNDDVSDQAYYPAAHPEVIGVGASNIQDYRCAPNDPDNTNWTGTLIGSNWGPYDYDLVAPGSFLQVDQFGNKTANSQGGTSYSAAIVGGIAALLLEKNPGLNWQELKDLLNSNTDRIRENTQYFYNEAPAGSVEVFHGRVSCGKALNATTVGVNETPAESGTVLLQTLALDQFQLQIYGNLSQQLSYHLHNPAGQMVLTGEIKGQKQLLELSSLPQGMYVLYVSDKSRTLQQNFKLIVSH